MEEVETNPEETLQFVDHVAQAVLDVQEEDRPDGMTHEEFRWRSLEKLATKFLEHVDSDRVQVWTAIAPSRIAIEIDQTAHLLQPRLEHLRVAYTQATLNELLPRPED